MNTNALENLGFTNGEIKTYLALLELGNSTAGPIIDKSGLQSSVVYLALSSLLEKGFITTIKEGKRNHYHANDPKYITNYIDDKKKQFEQILPELLLKQKNAKERSEIISFRGIKGIKELLHELNDAGGRDHNTFGSSAKSLMLGDAWWKEFHKDRAKKGIKAKLIFNESLKKWCNTHKYPQAKYKFTKTGFEPLTETIIRNNKIGIIIWTDKPLGTIIHDKEAAKSYDAFFKMMWKVA